MSGYMQDTAPEALQPQVATAKATSQAEAETHDTTFPWKSSETMDSLEPKKHVKVIRKMATKRKGWLQLLFWRQIKKFTSNFLKVHKHQA